MTGRWRPLPASLDVEVAYLLDVLRELKDRSGLSLAALAAKTSCSKSSWERYLNGTALPPKHAAEALARLVGEPVDRLLALWERAEARWSGRSGAPEGEARAAGGAARAGGNGAHAVGWAPPATGGEPHPARAASAVGHPDPPRLPPGRWVSATGVACLLAVALLAFGYRLHDAAPGGVPVPVPVTVGCRLAQCAGQDAYRMACDIDVASFADLHVAQAYLELRISDRCGAAWARVSHSEIGDRVQVQDRDGRSQEAVVPDITATAQYLGSPMIPAARHSLVRACVQRPDGERRCTPWGGVRPVPVPLPARTAGSAGPATAPPRTSVVSAAAQ